MLDRITAPATTRLMQYHNHNHDLIGYGHLFWLVGWLVEKKTKLKKLQYTLKQ